MAVRRKTTITRKQTAESADRVASVAKAADKAARKAVETKDKAAGATGGAAEFNRKCLDFAKSNLDAGLRFATDLATVRTPVQAIELHTEFLRWQLETAAAQSRELANLADAAVREVRLPFAGVLDKASWMFPQGGER